MYRNKPKLSLSSSNGHLQHISQDFFFSFLEYMGFRFNFQGVGSLTATVTFSRRTRMRGASSSSALFSDATENELLVEPLSLSGFELWSLDDFACSGVSSGCAWEERYLKGNEMVGRRKERQVNYFVKASPEGGLFFFSLLQTGMSFPYKVLVLTVSVRLGCSLVTKLLKQYTLVLTWWLLREIRLK